MVCIYCGSATKVLNSRPQKRANQIWRRRKCLTCRAVFTTIEAVDPTLALQFRHGKHTEPFSRDKLLLSVYDSLRHRKAAATDASVLTAAILSRLYAQIQDASLSRDLVTQTAAAVLGHFDPAAATHYRAFHLRDNT